MPNLIYAVDDDPAIRDLYACALPLGGFSFLTLSSGAELFASLKKERPSLIILDLMLPGEDGFEILRDLQSNTLYSDIPVIIVSAKNGESDKVKGLEMGASDYMDKPFGVMELLARCKANIRKSGAQSPSFKGLSYDSGKQRFLLNGSPMQLTNKEMEILKALYDHHGNLVKKDDLLHLVWPDAVDVETRTVDVHISMIRRKLAPYGIAISTVRGMGYILE